MVAFWFRRDLRLDDNHGLYRALRAGVPVLPVFIFDTNITHDLRSDDARLSFIHSKLSSINQVLSESDSGLLVKKGEPLAVWDDLLQTYPISAIYANHDYEPYGIRRDENISGLCKEKGIPFFGFKDQVIFEKSEITKADQTPYTVFTPYKKRWLERYAAIDAEPFDSPSILKNTLKQKHIFPSLEELGFSRGKQTVRPYDLSVVEQYDEYRNYPSADKGTYLGPHLRFGTVGIRKLVKVAATKNEVFLSELIWREFFMQILYHFPNVVNQSFRQKYDKIMWKNNNADFEAWKQGKTGYPMVDAGMRQLNETGYMHNRVRMVTASFLCKHLLIDWRWGEAYFAEKLLDYELSSNNGNWQWAAGTGCDAAPYFRVFNPTEQQKKFDASLAYIRKWVKDLDTLNYPKPIVEHAFARKRAIETYKTALS